MSIESPQASSHDSPVRRFVPLTLAIAAMWVAEVVDTIALDGRLDQFGILPREISGLDGIVWSPFLHGGFGHLISNTVPLVVLGVLVAARGIRRWLAVSAIIVALGGLGTWLFARSSIHIGASLLVFGYITYLITVGFVERRLSGIALGVVVAILYGGTLLFGVLPVSSGVSWEGHLFGALAGVGAAVALGRRSRAASAA